MLLESIELRVHGFLQHNLQFNLQHKFLYLRFMHMTVHFHVKVIDHLQKKFDDMGSPNKMKVSMGHGAKAWVSDFNHPHYMAGRKAMKTGRVSQYFNFANLISLTELNGINIYIYTKIYLNLMSHPSPASLCCSFWCGARPDSRGWKHPCHPDLPGGHWTQCHAAASRFV